ncbi:hypothetical protein [Stigmatella erecta]|uniref:Uncharacterized protein n=1 Tax=Stigmatella erecta TaxID=83460 RepID=A0A1I0IN34_9BACT|nr:hypothetical protein [Stigmatella erecta]SET98512.1 hypothetical protein SAMN05443639_106170 [Stigmatella erecta]
MQKIAAYLLERREGMDSPQARAEEATRLRATISEWLHSKGAKETTPSGTYNAEDGSHATFTIEEAVDGDRSWWMLRLEELTDQGRRFVTAVSVTNGSEIVAVYATMEVGSDSTSIDRVRADPRCPKVVRALLNGPDRWFQGKCELYRLRSIEGFDAGEDLVAELKRPDRTVPIIVVSEDAQGVALTDLHKILAYDLAGIANVVMVDALAAWALTDGLGKSLSCYNGAVRLYWPRLSIEDDPFRHPLWTRQRLASGGEPSDVTERFRRQLRGVIMHAAALGVVRPQEIDSIRAASSTRAFAEMKAKATSLADYAELADSYANENGQLRKTNEERQQQVEQLQARIAGLEEERAALLVRVENAEVQLKYREPEALEKEIPPDPAPTQDDSGPQPDETRFYKKVHSTPKYDMMERVGGCDHTSWQGAHTADKAKKGIAKLEKGRTDWKQIQHCGTCTGGGMWRVKW